MSGIRNKRGGAKKEVDLGDMVRSGASGAYEALQLYRSRAIRYKTKGDVDASLRALADGAKCLLENNYENAGAELAELFVELLSESNKVMTEDIRSLIDDVDCRFPSSSPKRIEYLKGCLKWTIATGTREQGDPAIQTRLGECLLVTGDRNAVFHFAAGEAPLALNKKIFELYDKVEQQETRERTLTLGVVNFVALENLRDANELMYNFLKMQKSLSFPTTSPLIKFCEYLLQTCRRDAAPLFKQLVNAYASIVDFDDAVPTLLMGPIALRMFGIQPKVNPLMSMLQSMLS
jgi:hypothetical protein